MGSRKSRRDRNDRSRSRNGDQRGRPRSRNRGGRLRRRPRRRGIYGVEGSGKRGIVFGEWDRTIVFGEGGGAQAGLVVRNDRAEGGKRLGRVQIVLKGGVAQRMLGAIEDIKQTAPNLGGSGEICPLGSEDFFTIPTDRGVAFAGAGAIPRRARESVDLALSAQLFNTSSALSTHQGTNRVVLAYETLRLRKSLCFGQRGFSNKHSKDSEARCFGQLQIRLLKSMHPRLRQRLAALPSAIAAYAVPRRAQQTPKQTNKSKGTGYRGTHQTPQKQALSARTMEGEHRFRQGKNSKP